MLSVCELAHKYGYHSVFDEVSFDLYPGQMLLLKGNNGSGKTSLLKIIAGLIRPYNGEVTYKGEEVLTTNSGYIKQVLYIGHLSALKPELSVYDNIQLFSLYHNFKYTKKRLKEVLEGFDLDFYLNERLANLSAGNQRKLALAKIMLKQANLLLLDEPFVGVDQKGIKFVEKFIKGYLREGGMVIISSHNNLDSWSASVEINLSNKNKVKNLERSRAS